LLDNNNVRVNLLNRFHDFPSLNIHVTGSTLSIDTFKERYKEATFYSDIYLISPIISDIPTFGVFKLIKEYNPHAKILVLSEEKNSDYKQLALQMGADYYLERPLILSRLVQIINNCSIEKWKPGNDYTEGKIEHLKGDFSVTRQKVLEKLKESKLLKVEHSYLYLNNDSDKCCRIYFGDHGRFFLSPNNETANRLKEIVEALRVPFLFE
jgi:DNA-binding NtrC family response regulator